MALADRLDALRARKREQQVALLAAVRAGEFPGVAAGEAGLARRRDSADHAGSLRARFPHLRIAGHGDARVVLVESRVRNDAAGVDGACRLPMPPLPHLADDARLRALHPELAAIDGAIDPARIAFLDVESTGLSGGTGTLAFLVGIGRIESGEFHIEQHLIEDFRHEPALLAVLAERFAAFDAFCTYNGRGFDVPLLRTRFALARRRDAWRELPNLDLLPFSRRLWRGALENVRLSTVEREVFGLRRGSEIDGAEIPGIWLDFARTGRAERLALVVERNAQDVATLAGLLALHVRCAGAAADPAVLGRASECLGIARWHEARKEWSEARRLVERALEICAPGADAEDALLLRLAALHHRAGDFAAATETWRALLGRPLPTAISSAVALAKHLEHRARDFAGARRIVHECLRRVHLEREVRLLSGRPLSDLPADSALEDLRRRLGRLERKERMNLPVRHS